MKRLGYGILVLVVLGVGWLGYRMSDRPSVEPYRRLELAPAARRTGELRATFFGVSTLLFDDGETAILVDGFFSRPSLFETVATRLAPDRERIRRELGDAGIERLAAILTVHSHYDHAMDVAVVAEATGAVVIGSKSTANIARGGGLAEERIRVMHDGERMAFGKLTVTAIRTAHFPHGVAMGEIEQPLVPPARAQEYLEGGSYSLLIEHEGRSLLVHGSAGYAPGALRGRAAEVVFLGLGGLGKRDAAFRAAYWSEVVDLVDARRVIPIHWDDFTLPLDRPLEPMPSLLDDFALTMSFLEARAKERGVDLRLAPARTAVDPFAALPAR